MKPFFAVLILSLLAATACDPAVSYQKIIRNKTDRDLIVLANTTVEINGLLPDSSGLLAKSNMTIADGFDIGGNVNSFSDCPGFPAQGDTLFIGLLVDGHFESKVLVTSSSTWKFKILDEDPAGGGSCRCILDITEDMIQ